MRKTGLRVVFLSVFLTLALVGVAQAHVEVVPTEVPAGSTEALTVSALGEKEIPVVEVRMEIPAGFNVTEVSPVDGWESRQQKDSSGMTLAIVWSGGEIEEGRATEFPIRVETPDEGGEYVWDGFDEYSDGSVTEWTGSPDSETPATLMLVGSGDDGSGEPVDHEEEAGDHHEEGGRSEGLKEGETVPDTGGLNPSAVFGVGVATLVASMMLLYRTARSWR